MIGQKQELGNLLTTKEAAEKMHVSTDYLNNLALQGKIKSIKIGSLPGIRGGRRIYPESEVNKWLLQNLRAC